MNKYYLKQATMAFTCGLRKAIACLNQKGEDFSELTQLKYQKYETQVRD